MEEEEKIEKDRQIVLHGHNARQRVLIPSEPSTSSAVPWVSRCKPTSALYGLCDYAY